MHFPLYYTSFFLKVSSVSLAYKIIDRKYLIKVKALS